MAVILERLWRDDSGQDLTEYALLVALIALVSIGAMTTLAVAINAVWSNVAKGFSNAV